VRNVSNADTWHRLAAGGYTFTTGRESNSQPSSSRGRSLPTCIDRLPTRQSSSRDNLRPLSADLYTANVTGATKSRGRETSRRRSVWLVGTFRTIRTIVPPVRIIVCLKGWFWRKILLNVTPSVVQGCEKVRIWKRRQKTSRKIQHRKSDFFDLRLLPPLCFHLKYRLTCNTATPFYARFDDVNALL